jgi:hypothetical protein
MHFFTSMLSGQPQAAIVFINEEIPGNIIINETD